MRYTILFVFAFYFCFTSCKSSRKGIDESKTPVARVYDKYLYLSDLKNALPDEIQTVDSVEIAQAYISNWVRQELLLATALQNIDKKANNFDKLIEEYKNSLVVHAYETEFVNQKMNSTITEQEIINYYDEHKKDFILQKDIVLANYVVVKNKSKFLKDINNIIINLNDENKIELSELCTKNDIPFYFHDNNWQTLQYLSSKFPMTNRAEGDFLKQKKVYQFNDSINTYFVKVDDVKTIGSLSPLSYEINNIEAIILNKRKTKLLEQLSTEIYKEALKNNKYEIFYEIEPKK